MGAFYRCRRDGRKLRVSGALRLTCNLWEMPDDRRGPGLALSSVQYQMVGPGAALETSLIRREHGWRFAMIARDKERKFKSDAREVIHASAAVLFDVDAIDKATMRASTNLPSFTASLVGFTSPKSMPPTRMSPSLPASCSVSNEGSECLRDGRI